MRNVWIIGGLALVGLSACSGGEEAKAPPPSRFAGVTFPVAGLTGDAAAGERAFGQCRTCHSVEEGVNRVGPSLHGVLGRQAGLAPDYKYTVAMTQSGKVWDEATLFVFLEHPRDTVPGTKMSLAGVSNPQQRADIIAYLKAQG